MNTNRDERRKGEEEGGGMKTQRAMRGQEAGEARVQGTQSPAGAWGSAPRNEQRRTWEGGGMKTQRAMRGQEAGEVQVQGPRNEQGGMERRTGGHGGGKGR